MEKSLEKWDKLERKERLLDGDPKKQQADIRRPERFYPKDGLVLLVNSRDLPRKDKEKQPARRNWMANAWNQDFAWFTKSEVKQFVPTKVKEGEKCDLPRAIVHRIACAHLIDNVRGQTSPFEERQVKKARLCAEVTGVEGDVVQLRLEGETRTEMEGSRRHGLEMKLLGNATYDVKKECFTKFELVAVGSRWGGTQLNGRRRDNDEAPIGILFTLAGDSPCERVAPAFTYHAVYRPVVSAE